MGKITVIGSVAMDLVTSTERVPEAGETVFGRSFSIVPGGKGANQAVAAARLAPYQVTMLGAVGQDSFGEMILRNFKENQLIFESVGTVSETTGIAQITLYNEDNRIIVVPGANASIQTEKWLKEWDIIQNSDLVILQNEIPHESNLAIAQFCKKNSVKVLYNPAPARVADLEMIDFVDFITPNEHECKELFPDMALEEALIRYPNKLIVTLGVKGVTYHNGTRIELIPALEAQVVDTTGAGDTFNGAFAFAITEGLVITEAIRFAVIASHLSVQKFGAQGGMPTLAEVKEHEKYEKAWHLK